MSGIVVTAFRWVPPFAQGLVRDLRVRWALEEAGLPYSMRLIGPDEQKSQDYRQLQPFGQVPGYEENGLRLFESGAIVMHVAQRSETLMPTDANERARVSAWMFAALNTLEPHIQNLTVIDLFYAEEEWAKMRRPRAEELVKSRLNDLANYLGDREYLVERFSAADILMTTVLRNLRHTDLIAAMSQLERYQKRCEARPAFQKALADQLAVFAAHTSVTG